MSIGSQAVLDALKQIGLNLYERKLYTALLARGTSTAGELSEIAGVPRSRAYDVLQSLADKGFVMVQNAKPLRYVAVSPEEGLDRHSKKLETGLKETLTRIDTLKKSAIIKEMRGLHTKGLELIEPGELTGSIQGRHSFHQQLSTMLRNANKKAFLSLTPQTLAEFMERHYEVLESAKKRGVKIRVLTKKPKDGSAHLKKLSAVADVRHSDFGGRFVVVDGEQFLMALTHDEEVHPTQDTALWSKSKHAATMMEPLFETVWQEAKSS